MANLNRTLLIATYNIKKWFANPRIYVIVILLFFYVHFMESPIKIFSQNVHINLPPFLMPFLISSVYSGKILLLLLILLFCDAPFTEEEYPYIIMRSGRKRWYLGQIFYIYIAAAFYTLLIGIITALVLIPNLELMSDWGKVINTFAQTGIASQHGIVIPFDYAIIQSFSPIEAMGLQFILCELIFAMFGKLMFLLNTLTSRAVGAVVATGVVFFQIFAENISPKLTYFSPASWISLSFLSIDGTGRYPSLRYALIVLIILNIVLAIASLRVVLKSDIKVLKNI
ncbi:MAG: hypothetical protein PHG16_06870 [Lachnospiraceae bacterium]|nr:hypothetical protein [Lachnospiraceae bacterium]